MEYADRGLSPRTKENVGELFVQLFKWRQFAIPDWDFERIAREQGVAILRAADIPLATAEAAVDEILIILGKVVRDNLN
jgi:hypothetical protein